MTTRRDFLRNGAVAAGVVFCGCGLMHAAHAQQARQKLPVKVKGKTVKTIDVHAHCQFREAGALLGDEGLKLQLAPNKGAEEAFIEIKERLALIRRHAGRRVPL